MLDKDKYVSSRFQRAYIANLDSDRRYLSISIIDKDRVISDIRHDITYIIDRNLEIAQDRDKKVMDFISKFNQDTPYDLISGLEPKSQLRFILSFIKRDKEFFQQYYKNNASLSMNEECLDFMENAAQECIKCAHAKVMGLAIEREDGALDVRDNSRLDKAPSTRAVTFSSSEVRNIEVLDDWVSKSQER